MSWRRAKLNWVSSRPNPALAVTNSPTRAPMRASVEAVLRAAKMKGRAVGRLNLKSIWLREAHIERISRREFSGTDDRPDRVLTRITKNAVETAITILEEMPNPNQTMNRGARTTD